ncbi:MAG: hypothetical protein WAK93_06605 [Solirubrobacteraceae bacterium]
MGKRVWSAGVLAAVVAAAIVIILDAFGPAYSGRAQAARAHSDGEGRVKTLAPRPPAGTPILRVGGPLAVRPVAAGFVGLSMEYSALTAYAGHDPDSIDPVFMQLVRNLALGQRPVLRIGGDSTDHAWVPITGMAKPPGVHFDITPGWLAVAGGLVRGLDARMIAGIDLEADSPRLAGVEANAILAAVGRPSLEAFELGNEPELYGSFGWYEHDGRPVPGRPPGWDVSSYLRGLPQIVGALPRAIRLAAPATGAANWMAALGQIAHAEPRVAVATVHRYPLHRCYTAAGSSEYPTIPHLLANASSTGLADSIIGFARTAHQRGLSVRVDEFNSVSCSGKRGVSDTFASALWALDGAFAMARAGADGINVHTFPGGIYQLFRFGHRDGTWEASVRPEYYGLMMFAQAAPARARLLRVAGSAGSQIRTWATRAPGGVTHVVLINKYLHRSRWVAVRIPGGSRPAALEWLRAPRISSKGGVTLDGRGFGGQTTTGVLPTASVHYQVAPVTGRYAIRLPAGSAAMLTLPA